MPSLFKASGYVFYFWANDGNEPVHVHIAQGKPTVNGTKFWLTKSGGCILANNKLKIPESKLNEFMDLISAQFFYICSEWKDYFKVEKLTFYC